MSTDIVKNVKNKKMLYILNVADRVNNFSYSCMQAALNLGMEFHIAGNWSYSSEEERKEDEERYGIKIHQIDFIRSPYDFRNIKAYKKLKELVETEEFDIIHCNTPVGGLLGRLVGKACGVKKVIYQVHGFHFYKDAPKKNWLIYYPIEKWLAGRTDALITINKEDFDFAQELGLKNDGKVYYVPGVGIDLSEYEDRNEQIRAQKRAEIGLCDGDFALVSVGRLDKNKNNRTIIEALNLSENRSLHLVLCGEGEERQMLENLAKELGVFERTHFLGNRSDMKEIYSAADAFVMASFREGLSRSIMEAMASGLPCVVSNIRGNVDLVVNGEGGFLFSPSSVKQLRESIDALLSSDLEKMSEFNLERINNFSLESVIQKTSEIYKNEFDILVPKKEALTV